MHQMSESSIAPGQVETQATYNCRICGNGKGNTPYSVREMMFGLRDRFNYFECGNCGCLQIAEIPADMDRYYPSDYYSYQNEGEDVLVPATAKGVLKRALKKALLPGHLKGKSAMPGQTEKFYQYFPWLRPGYVTSDARLLDVGCGSGKLLLQLYDAGFRNLAGVDPYIASEIRYRCGIVIHKKDVSDIRDTFDLVMMHHVFEHMDQPLDVLRQVHERLRPGGKLLIRIPVARSHAWETYRTDWVQLDAPRHFFLHTEQSMNILAEKSGFRIEEVVYDSWELQFYGSEQYRKDIPLFDKSASFSEAEMSRFRAEAKKLNEQRKGDSACFYLAKI